jgi:hypothetical protein
LTSSSLKLVRATVGGRLLLSDGLSAGRRSSFTLERAAKAPNLSQVACVAAAIGPWSLRQGGQPVATYDGLRVSDGVGKLAVLAGLK